MKLLHNLWNSVGGGTMPKPNSDGTAHLDSKLLDIAHEGWKGERPDDFLFSDFGGFTRHLHDDDPSDAPRRLADAHVSLILFNALMYPGEHTLVFQDDGGAGGLYVTTEVTDDYLEVSIVSNYAQLEYKESWYQAVLSLFDWYAYPAGMFNVNVFRKRWPRDYITLYVALQVSEIIVFVFDVLRSGAFRLLVKDDDKRTLFENLMSQLVIWPIESDFTFAESAIRLTRQVGMVPDSMTSNFGVDRRREEANLVNAYEIAAMNDDDIGMTSLSELQRLIRMRNAYLDRLRETLVAFSQAQNPTDFDDDWDDDEDDWFEPDDLIDDLIRAGLLDVAGNPTGDSESLSEAQGLKHGSSADGGDAGAYLIDVGTVTNPTDVSIAATLEQTMAAALDMSGDQTILACFAWPGGVTWITQGRPDCVIPADIVTRLAHELARYKAVLVWERPIPEPRLVESRFETATSILTRLKQTNALAITHAMSDVELTELGADEYVIESGNDDVPTFLSYRVNLDVFGDRAPVVRLDIMRDDYYWAVEGPFFMNLQFPCDQTHLFVSDDGWTIRIVDEQRTLMPFALTRLALAVQVSLGGEIREDGHFRLV